MDPDYTPPSDYRRGHVSDAGTTWFVGIIVALALLAIGYLVFSANSLPSVSTEPAAVTTPIN